MDSMKYAGTINLFDGTTSKEENSFLQFEQSFHNGMTSEFIFNGKKKTTAISQDKTLIERKIEQLKAQGRNYIVWQDNKSADISNTSILSTVPDVYTTLLTAITTRFRFYLGYPKTAAQTDVKQCGNQKTIVATCLMQQGSQETSGIAAILSSTDTLSEDTPGILQYLSKGDLINFNGKVINLYDQKPIECRHLAYAFATDEFGTKETGKFSSIAGVEKIAHHNGIKTGQQLEDSFSYKTAQEGYYFNRDGVGQAIYAACLRQKVTGEQTKGYLLHSLIHAMALKINWSPEQPEIKLTFYDPNDTLRVRRLVVSDLQTLKTIKVEDFIPDPQDIKCYYPEHSFGGNLITTVVKSPEGNPLIWTSSDINSSILHSMLTHGHFSPEIAEQVKEQLEKCEPEDRSALLMAKSNGGFPGLFTALQNGHEACVKTYCNLVIDSNIFSNEEKLALLMAKSDTGVPGLSQALQNGHKECVETFCKLVIDSNIFSNDEKRTLLMPKTDTGFPGLYQALQNGQKDSVETYCKQVMDSKIFSKEEKLALLMTKSDKGFPGLFMALQEGHDACVETYCKLVIDSNIFSNEEKLALLMAKSDTGVPGLFMALQEGHDACVETYCKLVIDSNIFSNEEKLALLIAKSDTGLPGLLIALLNGHKACFETYCKQVIDSKIFSNEAKLSLLMAKSDSGFPGLFVALQNGHEACVEIYWDLVMASDFSDEEKQALLMAKADNGFTGLHTALYNGHEACVKRYRSLIMASAFSDEWKKEACNDSAPRM